MTLPMPGSPAPSGAPPAGLYGSDPQEQQRSLIVPAGRPPWDELPLSERLPPQPEAPPLKQPSQGSESPPGQSAPGRGEHLHQQEAAQGPQARPGVAMPPHRSPVHAATHTRALAARGLAVFCVVATPTGLFVPENGARFWESAQYWSVFAAVCAVIQLAPLARPVFGWPARRAWSIGAFGVAGLLLFWVLIVLPVVSSDSAFVLTVAVAAAAGGAWLAPGRRIQVPRRSGPAAEPSARGL